MRFILFFTDCCLTLVHVQIYKRKLPYILQQFLVSKFCKQKISRGQKFGDRAGHSIVQPSTKSY